MVDDFGRAKVANIMHAAMRMSGPQKNGFSFLIVAFSTKIMNWFVSAPRGIFSSVKLSIAAWRFSRERT